jgi:hypothetical protein
MHGQTTQEPRATHVQTRRTRARATLRSTRRSTQIALDVDSVYYRDQSGIWRVPKRGGAATMLATAPPAYSPIANAFAVEDGSVAWWNLLFGMGAMDVFRVSKQGGAPTKIATVHNYVWNGVSGAPGTLYMWSGQGGVPLDYVSADGGVTEIFRTQAYTDAILYDAPDLYLAVNNGIQRLRGGTSLEIVGGLGNVPAYIDFMAMDLTTVFFTAGGLQGMSFVASVPKAGAPATVLFQNGGFAESIALDATHVYFVLVDRSMPSATIVRVNKDGSSPTTMFTSSGESILNVAVDDQCVYWTAAGNGTTPPGVHAMPK